MIQAYSIASMLCVRFSPCVHLALGQTVELEDGTILVDPVTYAEIVAFMANPHTRRGGRRNRRQGV